MTIHPLTKYWLVLLLFASCLGDAWAQKDIGEQLPRLLHTLYLSSLKTGLSAEDSPRFQVTVSELGKGQLKILNGFEKMFPKTRTSSAICFKSELGASARTIARIHADLGSSSAIWGAYFPALSKPPAPNIFLDLKAAGLSKERKVMSLPLPDGASTEHLLGMVRQGRVDLRLRLKQKPKKIEVNPTIATIQTNKGPVKFKLIEKKAKMAEAQNAVIFRTVAGKKLLEVPLSRFPNWEQVKAGLTVYGSMLRTRSIRLKAGSADDNGLIVRYPEVTINLGGKVRKPFGVLGLNEDGKAITKSKLTAYDAQVIFQEIIDGDCSYSISPAVMPGMSFTAENFEFLYPEAKEIPVDIFVFDPRTQDIGIAFDEESRPSKQGIVVDK